MNLFLTDKVAMSDRIKAIETHYNGYRFRSRVEARWAIFFDEVGIEYQYESEGFDMDGIRYLPDFYIPSLNRWFEIKGKPLSVEEIKKCEEFCLRMDNENIKYSILIGVPELIRFEERNFSILGIKEYVWQWPSELYPGDMRMLTQGLVEKEYYSRFLQGIWKVPDVSDDTVIEAAKKAREARFEFGETPKH